MTHRYIFPILNVAALLTQLEIQGARAECDLLVVRRDTEPLQTTCMTKEHLYHWDIDLAHSTI